MCSIAYITDNKMKLRIYLYQFHKPIIYYPVNLLYEVEILHKIIKIKVI